MLTPIKIRNIKNVEALQNFPFNSDHRAIRCTLIMTARRYYKNKKSTTLLESPTNENETEYQNELAKNLEKLDSDVEIDLLSENIVKAMKDSNGNTQNKMKKENLQKIPTEIQTLIQNSEELKKMKNKSTKTKIELKSICKIIKRDLRKFNKEKNEKLITQILNSTKNIKQI